SNSMEPTPYIYDLDKEKKDNIILKLVKDLSTEKKNLEFYTNDYSLYLKADSLDIDTHVYTPPVKEIYKGYINMKIDSYNDLEEGEMDISYLEELIDLDYLKPEESFNERDPINNKNKFYQNEYIFFNDEDKTYKIGKIRGNKIAPVSIEEYNWRMGDIVPKNLEQIIALDALLDPEVTNVSLVGRAGTGKTFLGIAASYLLSNVNYNEKSSLFGDNIKEHVNSWYEKYSERSKSSKKMISKTLFSRPLLKEDKLGFLPGDIESKMSPWLRGAFENLKEIVNGIQYANQRNNGFEDGFDCFFESGQKDFIDIIPLQYERGDSVNHKYWLVDEAQDLYNSEAKLVGTRIGKGSKLVLTGDPGQIGRSNLHKHHNGLVHMIDRLKESPLTSTIYFKDVERSQFSDEVSKLL
ncbi:MAG: PhoH family protein, partial [Candidatus Woesearchaeota archaeon]